MPYFFDTNVIVGYLFYDTDRLGPRATNRIDDDEQNHGGFTTSIECFGNNGHLGKASEILNEISAELLKISNLLHEQGLMNFRFQFNPKHFPRTGNVIQQYLESGVFTDDNTPCELKNLARKFETAYYKRKHHICDPDVCIWHPKRSNSYVPEEHTLSSEIQNHNDIQVLLDAHDAGQNIENLHVVTDDYGDILRNKKLIMETLPAICDVIRP